MTTNHRYFISFMLDGGSRFGNCDLDRNVPIASRDDMRQIEEALRARHHTSDLMVLAFSRYTDPTEPFTQKGPAT